MSIVVITGANRGIGLATAVTAARAGHTVIAAMRSLEASGDLDAIAASEILDIHLVPLDVDSDHSVTAAIDDVIAKFGRIDALVNNAGISGAGAVEEAEFEIFRKVMETNFFGSLRCTKAVLPAMRAQQGGCIVNLSSLSGRIAMAPQAPYAASKFALEAMSECLAQEVRAFNIRVALIEPGVVATSIVGSGARTVSVDSPYPHARRLLAIFSAIGAAPTSPYVVAERILDIIEGRNDRLRHPIGPDAEQFLAFRQRKSDEEILAFVGAEDADYQGAFEREFGIRLAL